MHRILIINIGSTSTKAGMFVDRDCLFKETVNHAFDKMANLQKHEEWLGFHRQTVDDILSASQEKIEPIDLVVSRGGLTRPIKAGAYRINKSMLNDLQSGDYGWHPCNVGPAIASEIAMRYGAEAIIYDSPVSDEMTPVARFSGFEGIERRAAFHVLSQKSAARRAALDLRVPYISSSFVVAHLGGGITICAHKNGRIIDGTHGIGEGPFTPQRTGALPLLEVLGMCFSGKYSKLELEKKFFKAGGVVSYLKTHDVQKLQKQALNGDAKIRQVLQAMGYQVSKEIGSMTTALSGRVDAVVITGGLAHAETVIKEVQSRIAFIGPVLIFPGEDEMDALAAGGAEVFSKKEAVKGY